MKRRDEELAANWGTICPLVEMIGADGRKRKIQAADTQGLLRLIQSIPSKKAEPFKMWLAHLDHHNDFMISYKKADQALYKAKNNGKNRAESII